jgi:excisionase family DNA binding protein
MSLYGSGMVKTNSTPKPAAITSGELLNDAQAAQLLGITSRTLRLWRHSRGVPHYKVTERSIRYKRSDLLSWLDRARVVIS